MCRQKDAKTVQGCALKTRSPCCAGAQNGEPPPLSPPPRRGTRGWINKYFKVGGLRFLQALTPRERCSRFIVASPSGPLSRHRERGWGERADTPVATLGAILCAVRIDFRLPPQINPYPAQPATGVLGQSPKRVLWYRAPGGTRGPLGKGGAAERWRVAYPIGIATRHGAKPATTRTYKSRPTPGRRTGCHHSVALRRR